MNINIARHLKDALGVKQETTLIYNTTYVVSVYCLKTTFEQKTLSNEG